MNLKYYLSVLLLKVSIVLAVQFSDCDKINAFYQTNKLVRDGNQENCCLWSNISCSNNNIKSFEYVDDSNVKIDFSSFPVLEEINSIKFQGKYLMGGSVPSIFFSQPKLVELILDDSNIWELPNLNSVSANSIETISLNNNLLTSFPYNLKSLSKLKNLKISNNKMSNKLNDELKELSSLENRDISSNFLNGNLPILPNNLKELIIDDNQFSSLSLSSSQSPNLEIFSANNNNLGDSSFSRLTDIKSLKKLSLDNTDLKEIPSSIDSLENLTYLSLRRNSISKLPESFGKLSLEELNISDNSNLNGKIKNDVNIKKCYINHTKVCIESKNVCNYIDSSNICGENGSSGFSTFIIIGLIIIIIALISYIVYFFYYNNNNKNNGFARMAKNVKEVNDSMYSNDSSAVQNVLKSRTSKEVINSINEAVNHVNSEEDVKAMNAEIAFSNGLKIVGSPIDACNLNKNANKNVELEEIFKDVDSIDGEITQASGNNFENGNIIPSLNRSVISNPGINSDHTVPIFNSLPRLNYMNNTKPNLSSHNNYILNNNNPFQALNTLNTNGIRANINDASSSPSSPSSPISVNLFNINNTYSKLNTNTQTDMNDSTLLNINSGISHNSVGSSNIEIKKRPRSRSSLAKASESITNNNMNILRMNARDTIMPGIRQDYAKDYVNEYNNKINIINSERSSQVYTNDLWNTVNGFNLENFNNFNTIQNSPNQKPIKPKNSVTSIPSISVKRNLSFNSTGSTINTDTNTNITSLITSSNSISFSSNFSSSFSEDELSKNIMFQNPSINKSNSNRTGNSNNLLPIFNHKDSIKSSTNCSVSTGNVSSSFDLHLDSVELDEFLNELHTK
ncbi:L domain-like protein [Neocallimastix californiae]|uniref:L domain-like protein n=1 Tax=Neocallimastix californiae TaxID=1754190 RepID=A0A1Y2FRD9_9FUNG|nr:L domain-like protein [Neocallimastix californiae]|eukprot:ORY86570.1 L domain-like protein [Neocallimastix californiae]